MKSASMLAFMVGVAALQFVTGGPARAQDGEVKKPWSLETELGLVQTAGNSESSTFGLSALFKYMWTRSEAKIDAGGIRTESSLKTRTAVGTSSDFVVLEEKHREKTAENFYVRGRYDFNVTELFGLFGGADWRRNIFAGIRSRTLVAAGAANTWRDNDKVRFKTDYSGTYTFEDEVVENPFTKTNFPGLRLSYDLWWKLTETTEFTSNLIGDWNLDNTDDLRADFSNSLSVLITSKLALKLGLDLLWRNDPALVELPLFDSGGADTGETVFTPLEELDEILTVTLVVKI